MSSEAIHRAAEELLRLRLAPFGIGLEPLPDLPLAYAMLLPGGRMQVVKLLAREGPHLRGGRGDLGMHWMLRSDVEDFVALVDTRRENVWLMPSSEFRSKARLQRGARWHLDWFVERRGRSIWSDEGEFEDHGLERALERLLKTERVT